MSRSIRVEWHPEAIADARAARIWYEKRNPRASEAFVEELDLAADHIGESPNRWPEVVPGFRRFLLNRYPFGVVFRVFPDHVEIVAVAHGRRRPGYWQNRTDVRDET